MGRDWEVDDFFKCLTGELGALNDAFLRVGDVVVVGVTAEAAAVNRSDGRSCRSLGLHSSWKIPAGSLGARNVRKEENPPAAMLLARISSASLTPKGGFDVISQ